MPQLKFQQDIERFAKHIDAKVDVVLKKLAIQIHDGIVLRTPVDTGRCRASWTIGVGKADLSVQPESFNDPGSAEAIASKQRSKLDGPLAEKRVVIANNLPYVNALENGHSKQAPTGMVKITVAEAEAGIKATLA